MEITIRTTIIREPDADPVSIIKGDVARLAPLGFDGLELCIQGSKGSRGPFDRLSAADVEAIKQTALEAKLSIPTLSSDWLAGFASAHPNLADWDGVEEGLAKDLALAQALGAKVILIHFGSATGRWHEAVDVLKRMAAVAERSGVRLGFEASLFRRTQLGGLAEVRRLVDDVDSPALGIYEHPHYPRAGLRPEEEIELFGPRLVGIHLGAIDRLEADWNAFLGAIKRYYAGPLVLEVPHDTAEENKRALEERLATKPSGL